MAATRPPTAGKGKARTSARGATARGDDDAADGDAPETTRGPRPRPPRRGVGVFPTVVTVLAGVLLMAGVAFLTMGLVAYETLNLDGTYTVDQQVEMAKSAVYSGVALVAASLVTLGLVVVGLRVARP